MLPARARATLLFEKMMHAINELRTTSITVHPFSAHLHYINIYKKHYTS